MGEVGREITAKSLSDRLVNGSCRTFLNLWPSISSKRVSQSAPAADLLMEASAQKSMTWSGSRRPSGVGIQQATEAGGTNDFARQNRVLWRRWFVPSGWEMVTGGVRSFGVVPVFQFTVDVVQMSFGNDQESIQGFHLQSLDHPFDVCPQVGRLHRHLGNFDAR